MNTIHHNLIPILVELFDFPIFSMDGKKTFCRMRFMKGR